MLSGEAAKGLGEVEELPGDADSFGAQAEKDGVLVRIGGTCLWDKYGTQ